MANESGEYQSTSMVFDIDTSAIQEIGQGLAITLTQANRIDVRSNIVDFDNLGKNAVSMAKSFLKNNANHHPGKRKGGIPNGYLGTGALYKSIQYSVEGRNLKLSAPAVDKYGHSYGGYVEYGSKTRGGAPQGPWPFLRPALQFMVERTKSSFADTMKAMLAANGVPLMNSTHGSMQGGYNNIARSNDATRQRYASEIRSGYGSTQNHPSLAWGASGQRQTSTFFKGKIGE